MSFIVRPSADISTLFGGGPTACDANEALFRQSGPRTCGIPLTIEHSAVSETSSSLPLRTSATRAARSRTPNGSTPLNSFWARPSQKLRKLKTALITEGALRPVTRRTLTPPTLKIGSVPGEVVCSTGLPGATPLKIVGSSPAEPATSSVSNWTSELRSSGGGSRWNGKSLAVSWSLGWWPTNGPIRGLSWFLERLSAPAAKWQVAHAVWPSLPSCMSQNSALPSATPAASSLTNSPRFCGSGTGAEPSGVIARGRSGGGATASPPPSPARRQTGRPINATTTATRVALALSRRPPNRTNRILAPPLPLDPRPAPSRRHTGSATDAGLGPEPPREGPEPFTQQRYPRGACPTLMPARRSSSHTCDRRPETRREKSSAAAASCSGRRRGDRPPPACWRQAAEARARLADIGTPARVSTQLYAERSSSCWGAGVCAHPRGPRAGEAALDARRGSLL